MEFFDAAFTVVLRRMSVIIVVMSFYLHCGLSKMTLPSSRKTHERNTLLSVQFWRFTSDELQERCKKAHSYSIQQGHQGCSSSIIIKLIYKLLDIRRSTVECYAGNYIRRLMPIKLNGLLCLIWREQVAEVCICQPVESHTCKMNENHKHLLSISIDVYAKFHKNIAYSSRVVRTSDCFSRHWTLAKPQQMANEIWQSLAKLC